MAFLCPSRLGRTKNKRGYYDSVMGRITGSDSIETLVKLELGKQNSNNPETRRIILQSFTGYAPEEISVKQGQKVNILFREGDWAYVLTHDKKQGYVPFTFCARLGKPPSYRAPKLIKDKEKLLTQDETDSNENDTYTEEIDTTLAEPNDESYYSEFVSESFISDEWSEKSGKFQLCSDNSEEPDTTPDLVKGHDNSLSESLHINPVNDNSRADLLNAVLLSGRENLAQSVIINTPKDENGGDGAMSSFKKSPVGRYLVLYDFQGYYEDDVSVKQADIVTVLNIDDSDWFWVRKTDNREGFVPSNFLFRLGLLFSETKATYENVELAKKRIIPEKHSLRQSPSLGDPISVPDTSGFYNGKHFETRNDENPQCPYTKRQNSGFVESDAFHVKYSQGFTLQSPSPETGHASPQNCKFNFETNGINRAITNSQAPFETQDHFSNFHNASDENPYIQVAENSNDCNTEIYPPPREFSNISNGTIGAFHESVPGTDSPKTRQTVVDGDIEGHYPSHVRYNSQPAAYSVKQEVQRNDIKTDYPAKTNKTNELQKSCNNSSAEVRYRSRTNEAKNRARPKSTPPVLSLHDIQNGYTGSYILNTNQYYTDENGTRHYDPQQGGTRITVHQSERLTPRTNYNYSPTYHSSVWKPSSMSENIPNMTSEECPSAFQKPPKGLDNYVNQRNKRQTDASIDKPKTQEVTFSDDTPYYPSGVYNIRSTTDFQKAPVQKTIRELSDKENRDLYRKLDNTQNSYYGNERESRDRAIMKEKKDTFHNANGQFNDTKHNNAIKNMPPTSKSQSASSGIKNHYNQTKGNEKDNCKTCQSNEFSSKFVTDNISESNDVNPTMNSFTTHAEKDRSAFSFALNQAKDNEEEENIKPVHNIKDPSVSNQTVHEIKDTNYQSSKADSGSHMEHKSTHRASNQTGHAKAITAKHNYNNQKHSKANGVKGMTEFVSQFDYKATSKTDLPLKKGEIVHISLEDQSNKHWYWVYSPKLKRHGYVPRNYVLEPQVTMI